jgi:hypothetical protein
MMANQKATAPWRTCIKCSHEGPAEGFANGRNTCRACWTIDTRRRVDKDRPLTYARNTEWRIRAKYGITGQDYEDMLWDQNYACAICAEPPAANRKLCIDHCHTTGRVRGLLCNNRNALIGMARERESVLRSAIIYLKPGDH